MRDFKRLKIWQKGMRIAIQSFVLIDSFPREEKFGLCSQITRAAVSIPSNIAEGSGRGSDKEYKRFLEIALGSGFELETQLLIAQYSNFGKQDVRENLLKEVDEEQKMLMSFIQKLKNS